MIATIPQTLYVAFCAVCGWHGPAAYDSEQAQRLARDAGWAELRGKTLCPDPDCRKRAGARKK